jgi:LacI family transcriptional regulator, gluconate utilization system Gnt-I transcriptional repressor
LSVPGDIAIAGFGNFEVSWCSQPTITTVSVDAYGIGLRAGEALLAELKARETPGTNSASAQTQRAKAIKIDFTVIPREST